LGGACEGCSKHKKEELAMKTLFRLFVISLGLITFALSPAWAEVAIPNTFTPGTTAKANEVNANFSALANAMPAVKSITSATAKVITSTTGEEVLSISVTPPTDGYVLVIGSGTSGISQSSAGYNAIDVSLATTSETIDSANIVSDTLNTTTSYQQDWNPFSIFSVFPVSGGVTSIFYLNARIHAGSTTATFYIGNWAEETKLTALFFPGLLP